MKHLYKTKEGEILEATRMDYKTPAIYLDCKNSLVYRGYSDEYAFPLSEVQEVVLDKDGEPFMFRGKVVCVGDEVDGGELVRPSIIGWYIFDNKVVLLAGSTGFTEELGEEYITSHTPKHPQNKGIENIEYSFESMFFRAPNVPIERVEAVDKKGNRYNLEEFDFNKIIQKLNETIDTVNKLKG